MIEPGTKLIRQHSPELGVGVVVGTEGRFVDVFFPDVLERQRLAQGATDVRIVTLGEGDMAKTPDGEVARIASISGKIATMETGTKVVLADLWPVMAAPTGLSRLIEGSVDPIEDVLNRLDGLALLDLRREGTVQSLLGGRIELFPHQLDTAARAIEAEQVRWLVADEVGLGKTIVACLTIAGLVRMGRVERALIVAPDTLTVQWLGELYHKFHQVFVHVDADRVDSVRTDIGPDANPFDVHPLAVVSFEFLRDPAVMAALEGAPPELVVVDEAHQALRPDDAEHVLPLVERTRHALMLTATPFQLGRDGFLELADTLDLPVINRDVPGAPTIVKGVSAVTRADIHTLPARAPSPVPVSRYGKLTESDPRVAWLLARVHKWREAEEKALIFVNSAADAVTLAATLERASGLRTFVFHEEMGTKERDIELARFRISGVPFMVSSGAGSEGRNFQFCHRLVHLDLPDDPVVLEQRIGRLDRIGRSGDIPIHWFVPTDGSRAQLLAATYSSLGIFGDATVGASPAMVHVSEFLADQAGVLEAVPGLVDRVRDELEAEAVNWIFPSSHDRESAAEVMAGVPNDLDERIERFCIDAAERVGLDIVPKDGESAYFFEHGNTVVVDTIPGMPHGTRFLGSFSRSFAVLDSECEFFANGHPLVEGLLLELEDSVAGRSCAVTVEAERLRGVEAGLYLGLVRGRSGVTTREAWRLLSGTAEPADDSVADALIDALYEAPETDAEDRARLLHLKPVRRALDAIDSEDVVLAALVVVEG